MTDATYTIKQAAAFCGRTESTIRSWVRTGRLVAKRHSAKGNAPLLIRHDDLMTAMHTVGLLEPGKASTKVSDKGIKQGVNEGMMIPQVDTSGPSAIVVMERLLEAVTAERDRLLKDSERDRQTIEQLRQKLETEQAHSRTLDERIAALEREIHSLGGTGKGILGYLSKRIQGLVQK